MSERTQPALQEDGATTRHFHGAVVMDAAYMKRRQEQEFMRYQLESLHRSLAPFGKPRKSDVEQLKDDYAAGRIDFETFERRVGEAIA